VIECEAEKLSGQGLSVGSWIAELATRAIPGKKIALIKTSTLPELTNSLANALREYGRFRSILLVGHSNAARLKFTNETFCRWDVVAKWVAPFSPEFLLLAACEAGQFPPAGELFRSISSLREVYASPVALWRDQTDPLALLVFQLLKHRRIDETLLRVTQVVNFAATDGLLYRWKRGEFRPGKEISGIGWTVAAKILNQR